MAPDPYCRIQSWALALHPGFPPPTPLLPTCSALLEYILLSKGGRARDLTVPTEAIAGNDERQLLECK